MPSRAETLGALGRSALAVNLGLGRGRAARQRDEADGSVGGATQRLGCGVASCTTGGFPAEIWVCNYDPPGNYVGKMPY